MVRDEQIEFGEDGGPVVVAVEETVLASIPATAPASAKRVQRIYDMIAAEDTPIADVLRQIALEMADVMRKMTADDPLERGTVSLRDLNEQMKSWQVLQKTLTESDEMSRRDTLNLDGPKFRFIFLKLIGFFEKALKDGGVTEDQTRNIMLQFGDMVKSNDDAIRRELSKIEVGR